MNKKPKRFIDSLAESLEMAMLEEDLERKGILKRDANNRNNSWDGRWKARVL